MQQGGGASPGDGGRIIPPPPESPWWLLPSGGSGSRASSPVSPGALLGGGSRDHTRGAGALPADPAELYRLDRLTSPRSPVQGSCTSKVRCVLTQATSHQQLQAAPAVSELSVVHHGDVHAGAARSDQAANAAQQQQQPCAPAGVARSRRQWSAQLASVITKAAQGCSLSSSSSSQHT